MAAYPKYQPQFGIYNPNNFSKQPTANDGLTIDTAKLYFLQFPNAQTSQTEYLHSIGVSSDATFNGQVTFNETVTYNQDIEFLANVLVDGTATVMDNLLCESTATVTDILTCEAGIDISVSGGITFPDNTTQTTAFIEANYAQLNTDNTFLTTFTNDFNGNVNLNGITNGVTPLTGDNSTLLATTEFVQNTVQVAGVQTTDSPLLWTGANTNQYNAGTTETLPYSYPYGLSQLYNLSGGNEEYSLVANNGIAGASPNAFNIYCVQGDTSGDDLRLLTPQLTLSNNGSPMFVKDGINVNSGNITNIGALSGIGGNVSCFSNLLFGVGNNLNLQTNNIINCNSITDTTGQYVTTNTPPDNTITTAIATTGYVETAISNIPPITGYAVLNQGGTQNWLGNNTCSNGIWDYRTNSSVLVQTVANTTNNNTAASTAFVKANAGVFTQTSFSLNPSFSTYYTLNPTSVSVITTYVSASNTVSFNSVQFVITITTVPTFFFLQLTFSASPFTGAPPATTQQPISLYCSNGATYTGQLNWISATSISLGISGSGPTLTSGMTFTSNLANLGAFTP